MNTRNVPASVPVGEQWPDMARASASPCLMPLFNPSTTGRGPSVVGRTVTGSTAMLDLQGGRRLLVIINNIQ